MQYRRWFLGVGMVVAIGVVVGWTIYEASADPLRGIETVAIEPIANVPDFVQEGVLGQLSVQFRNRGIRLDAANPDAVIHIDVDRFELTESGFYVSALLEIKKKTGEHRKMIFTLSIDRDGINARLRRA